MWFSPLSLSGGFAFAIAAEIIAAIISVVIKQKERAASGGLLDLDAIGPVTSVMRRLLLFGLFWRAWVRNWTRTSRRYSLRTARYDVPSVTR